MTTTISKGGARRRSIATLICGALAAGGLAAAGVTALVPGTASASSHREAPLISGTPQFDNTDLYAFVSPDKADTTTIVANWIPFEEPGGGPNFYQFAEDAQYDLHIDNNGDAQDDLLFRYTFKTHVKNKKTFLYNTGAVDSLYDKDLNVTQTYDIELIKLKKKYEVSKTKIADDVPVAPSNVGKASMPDYAKLRYQAVHKLTNGSKTFAGQADDPFFADLRVFDLLYGGNLSEVGNDTLKGYNVNTIALQVPTHMIVESSKQPVVGIWSTTQRKNASGYYSQVSRLGMPLVNEVVNPIKDKDKFNASSPYDDAQFLKNVTNPELPKLIEAIYKIPAPKEPRNDLVDVFLKGVKGLNQPPYVTPAEELRLNTSTKPSAHPKRLGVLDGDNAGFPNGRRLTDDVIDASLQVVEGELLGAKNDLGDAVDKNDKNFEKYFPYVALPTEGSRGPLAKGTSGTNDVRSQLGDALQPAGTSGGGTDTMLIAGSAAAGAAGFLLLTAGFVWWRRNMGNRAY
ncbi:DUF4331 domain-containing protein [Streptomyces turgidiscabies]|uniref:Uncharacterized protein n=1 Tax=Streptomyces turgidiscabies (strain Car8) TaxID=698760 RepID=L7FI99_STRT8|nr:MULTISPECIES: DUF4331 domain-containing protein [Streptomyces]ELP70440.1 hypothetical protein STRTUCAR8_02539 [Streptomyces turgidiscabies Car8]MDX3493628.1 DUF4331 domain-containing protein [Streptomyces turgidiscabies]GAQ71779.1 hypothetical protein T45_03523 [Streptomyces turgidiscabies]